MRRATLIPAMALLSLLSCNRQKDAFVLHGTIEAGGEDSILVVGLDSRFSGSEIIRYCEGQFDWSFVPDTVTPLLFIMSDGTQYPVFAEKATESVLLVPVDSGMATVSGGTCNDIVSRFRRDCVSDTSDLQTIARIDSVIKSDPFTETAPYLIYEYMVRKWHCDRETIDRTIAGMSGNMQDSPYLVNLRNTYPGEKPPSIYLSDLSITDTTGVKVKFQDLYPNGYVLVCVWASWHEGSVAARKAMETVADSLLGRKLKLTDISIDTNGERWKQCVSRDSLGWESFNENGGWYSKIIRSTFTNEIPVYMVFSSLKKVVFQSESLDEAVRYITNSVPEDESIKKSVTDKKKSDVSSVPKKLKLQLDDKNDRRTIKPIVQ